MTLNLGLNFNVSREDYDADPGLNQSKLKALLSAKSPAHFRYDQDHPDADKKHFRLGNAIDLLCNKPHEFGKEFVVYEGDRRGNAWKEFKLANADRTILTASELDQVKGMVAGLERNEEAANIILNSQKQVAVIANHQSGFRMKALMDFFPGIHDDSEWLFDLKSTARGADEATFSKSSFDLGYHIQAAYYMDACQLAGITRIRKFGFIVIENFPPYECAIRWLGIYDEETDLGRNAYMKAASEYRAFNQTGVWPGYSKSWSKVAFNKWQLEGRERQYETID